ncbi:ATP-grasp domain-containing protein [Brevibacterium sp. 50QC2O2]|uniref:acetyl/propionyl/methylcrotonyl-CoA carboxylase subunit alpha n=1 Tax=unclassified Brevibacterium TaxID=2614124 RepID=UPI00211C5C62|nr:MULTISPECIES: biotin carboxylase N-terminal domain-containing protein [unclassified Brevibacterium]MCQ9367195.1 ATP-grasp domain-containing protein [Brevibacterium sp. 91QC2O2]MCQ9389572.1 ATP-grasp domain-containing protein [Brevibacterium sp. 50QC2O2]
MTVPDPQAPDIAALASAPTRALTAVLIANRGEIAMRIIRAARDLGLRSIAVYSDADADAPHVRLADEAHRLPGVRAADTYLNMSALLAIATSSGADCVHPGYGFLSENADFARAVTAAGLRWIGPSAPVIEALGDKVTARAMAAEVGVPLAPGTPGPVAGWEDAHEFALAHGLPIAIKAAHGGGGRGLKVVNALDQVEQAYGSAVREAQAAFGRGECFVEKFLVRPRHVEAQILADAHGRVAVIGTRDCSLQRRNQKLVEEAPAPGLSAKQEHAIVSGARRLCERAGYTGAGTAEFLVAADGTVSFLEVNTRVQVEHPVTEAVTRVDIVAEQFRIAAGLELSPEVLAAEAQAERGRARGHAFEFRINAEDVDHGFVPAPGTVTRFEAPTGPGVRVDAGVCTGTVVPSSYDSLLAKLIVWGPSRAVALRRARAALDEIVIEGVRTVLPFHRDIVRAPDFASGPVHTGWIEEEYRLGTAGSAAGPAGGAYAAEAPESYPDLRAFTVEIDGRAHRVRVPAELLAGPAAASAPEAPSPAPHSAAPADGTPVTCGFAGTLVRFSVADGAQVAAGDEIAVVEAMKMECQVAAPASGTVSLADLGAGDEVQPGRELARIRP